MVLYVPTYTLIDFKIDQLSIGFETFSTIGYGDRTPQTPAGRSVFIVWALHGVGTMTILISGVQSQTNSNPSC